MNTRVIVKPEDLNKAMDKFHEKFIHAVRSKSMMGFVGLHEIRGSMDEEFDEFKEAVHENNINNAIDELADMMVVAYFGMASLEAITDAVMNNETENVEAQIERVQEQLKNLAEEEPEDEDKEV